MNPLMAMPGISGGFSATDTGSAVSGDIHGKNQNGGAIHFAPTWQSYLPLMAIAGAALVGLYIWKK